MRLDRLAGHETLAHLGALTGIYRDAFREPPWHEDQGAVDAFAERLASDAHRPGFTAVLAHVDGAPAGFGTAWRTPDPFPTGRAYDRVRAQLGDDVRTRLVGALEVDELAVSPHARGRGLAERILALLCEGADTRWLLTDPRAAAAIRLYRRLGWTCLTPATSDIVVFGTGNRSAPGPHPDSGPPGRARCA
jgi:ribosomal protein S18 acetylase RimI-like enzyme